jgi:hypothetical protein
METPASDSAGLEKNGQPVPPAIPTERDLDNARRREAIAEKQEAQYVQCLAWALGAFGPGWIPSHRHYLVEKDEEERARRTGEKPTAAATIFTVRDNAGRKRHFSVEGGSVCEHAGYEAGFGSMLLEPHPTRGFEHRGQWCPTHRYSLCWAGYERYHPKTAEELASLRATREQNKAEREVQKWRDEHPLFLLAGIRPEEG